MLMSSASPPSAREIRAWWLGWSRKRTRVTRVRSSWRSWLIGCERTKDGRSREALQAWLTRLVDSLHGRIHGFNASIAHIWAEQEHQLTRLGQRMPVEDSYLAATARRYNLTIVTGNDKDFRRSGLKVSNPFKELKKVTE